uniref:TrmE-type G domain-containing protein n=1 Tax=Panagrolaimus sp. PS1159 TaxID=55785 RepID=A0AC35GHT8_9BILA
MFKSFKSILLQSSPSTSSFSRRFQSTTTIFALSSGSLPSGVAIIRISGPKSFEALKKLTRQKKDEYFTPKKLFYTKIYDISETLKDGKNEDEILDHGMAVWLPVELFLHGSKAVVNAVCNSLAKIENVEAAKAGEFTKRAFFNGKYNISQVESLNDLINAETESQRKLALKQNKAGKYLEPIREKLINLMAQIQAAIDFGEDIENQKIDNFSNIAAEILAQLRKFERSAKRGSLIREGIKVAIVGKTNVGKSSLMNRLAEKDVAIVSNISGTTRDFLETRLHLNAIPVTVVDTAGIRETADLLEKEGIRRSFEKANEANIIVYVFDAKKLFNSFEIEMKEVLPFYNESKEDGRKVICCINKADLLEKSEKDELNKKILQYFNDDKSISLIWTSCFEEFGLSTLTSSLKESINDFCNIESDELVLSRQRHILLLSDSILELELFLENLLFDQALAAQHLSNAATSIGEISGTIVNEQILDKIFSQFCIGK